MFQNIKNEISISIFFTFLCLGLIGCNNLQTKIDNADSLASNRNFIKKIITTDQFNIVSYQKTSSYSESAVIYIEGDGSAWLNKYRISPNPTPVNPVALELALLDQSANVIYLGRPCQYVDIETEATCTPEYWTNKRVSSEVIDTIDAAINNIKKELNIKKIRLIGYSGGGTIATILAATRDDIIDLRTIAGNLDIEMFSKIHNISPLTGSLNPIDYASQLVNIPQLHFISTNDTIITKDITESFIDHLKKYDEDQSCIKLIELDAPSHTTGWDSVWQHYQTYTQKC